ncbi:mechanosensitive ion channel [Flavobacteriaceae bacterium KMM 6897]|nr:mechanosensitive ion channel [Flavobacteriaceae bacterium KMM 6897]MEB8347542.1 mechanosensitive ion channel [Flavobacteriaceae bacterium KMM 6898]
MDNKFSLERALMKLWDKLYNWLDMLILKLPNILMAIGILILFYFIAKGTQKLFRKVLLKQVSQVSIRDIVSKVIFVTILMTGFFIALGVLELDKLLTSILAGAGVIGLAIGLALQGTLSNTFGGLVLSFMDMIRINDYIETDETAGFVTEISLRNMVIRKPDNNYVVIPNSKFIDGSFTNYSLTPRSKISVSCGVGYESSLQKVEDIVVKLISENFKQQDDEAVEFYFTEFGDSSINFFTRFSVDMINSKQELIAKHKAIKLIKEHFDKQNINIPFPIRTLDFGKNNLQVLVDKSSDKA